MRVPSYIKKLYNKAITEKRSWWNQCKVLHWQTWAWYSWIAMHWASIYLQPLCEKYFNISPGPCEWHNLHVFKTTRTQNSQGCKGIFGSNSSKSTKFSPHISYTLLFRFLMGVKKGVPWDWNLSKIQNGRLTVLTENGVWRTGKVIMIFVYCFHL